MLPWAEAGEPITVSPVFFSAPVWRLMDIFFFGQPQFCLISFPALGKCVASEMKHQILFALKDFQVGQTTLHPAAGFEGYHLGENQRHAPIRKSFPLC